MGGWTVIHGINLIFSGYLSTFEWNLASFLYYILGGYFFGGFLSRGLGNLSPKQDVSPEVLLRAAHNPFQAREKEVTLHRIPRCR